MDKLKFFLLTVMLLIPVYTTGCFPGRGKNTQKTNVQSTTKGQELIDLQKAYDLGIITTDEFEKQRAQILKER